MRRKFFTFLFLGALAASPPALHAATEWDEFIPSNGGSFPTMSALLSVEEAAINKILRDDFVKTIRFTLGSTLLDRTVRVGDVLEGHVTVTAPGMSEFSFTVHKLAVDVQENPPPFPVSKMVVRMDMSLYIGTVFVRRYAYDWTLNSSGNSGPERSVILLDRDLVMDLWTDIQNLTIGVTRDHICAAIPSLGAAACQEYEWRIMERLRVALRYLPLIRDYAKKNIDLSPFRNQVANYYKANGQCRVLTPLFGTPVTCPSELISLVDQAINKFNALTYAMEDAGGEDGPAYTAWIQARDAVKAWVQTCSANTSNPLRNQCLTMIPYLSSYASYFGGIYDKTLDKVEVVMQLLSEDGMRIGTSPIFLANGRIFGALDRDRIVVGTSFDVKALTPAVTFQYDVTTGYMTITANTAFSILSLAVVDGWFNNNLLMPVSGPAFGSLYYDASREVYEMRIDMRASLLYAYQYKWWQNQYCPGVGCPPPSYANMAGTEKDITVYTSVGADISNIKTVRVKL